MTYDLTQKKFRISKPLDYKTEKIELDDCINTIKIDKFSSELYGFIEMVIKSLSCENVMSEKFYTLNPVVVISFFRLFGIWCSFHLARQQFGNNFALFYDLDDMAFIPFSRKPAKIRFFVNSFPSQTAIKDALTDVGKKHFFDNLIFINDDVNLDELTALMIRHREFITD